MIDVSHLSKNYGPTSSLIDMTFRAEEGEVLGFLGPNGAGKSTTMRILTGLARPTSGTATIAGFDVQRDHLAVRGILGYVPEQTAVYPDMTVAGYLEFLAGTKGIVGRDRTREMERVSGALNLQRERGRLLRNLSKGTRQRALIAQALLGDPKVLILDEPTVGLDPAQINDVRGLIREMAGRRTVILSTHILSEVELTCSRVAIVAAGRVVAQGTRAELLERAPSKVSVTVRAERAALEAALDVALPNAVWACAEGVGGTWCASTVLPGEQQEPGATVGRAVIGAGLELHELRVDRPSLEDVFLRAVGRKPA